MDFDENTQEAKPVPAPKSEVWEWTKAILIAVVLVIIIRVFIFKPFIVDGPSMQPNFYTGERLIVSEWVYHLRKPHRGEVVVFHATEEKDYIKRVIALPGETIAIADGKVLVNGKALDEPYIADAVKRYKEETGGEYNATFQEQKVPDGMVFVLGDNRVDSTDSRVIGPVAYDKIIGRADIVFWPLNKLTIVNHKE
ncbi:signal peptidase I [Gorillibacterium sp. sgz500922]|uniref:signal peptidase I n=1 Tax=Gorillibacterium sp. sgz500922 TaxID=3446694 RepID=UPI003F666896